MSMSSIGGLVLLNLFLLAVGVAVLFAVRGWHSWGELGRLLGFAYMLGVAVMGVAFVLELVSSVPFTIATTLLTGVVLVAAGVGIGRVAGRSLPPRPRALRPPRPSLAAAVFGGATVLYLEALFRAGRLAPLSEYDAWAFWVPKAQALYVFHGLDIGFFKALPGQSYPPLVPALEAVSFQFMGSADVVTLHLQFWFLFVGFVGAVVGLLAGRVPRMLLWPPLLLALIAPQISARAMQPQGDLLVDEFVALGAVLVALWLTERGAWQLGATTPCLAAGMLTKREGFLFAACILAAALVASWRDWRHAAPRLAAVGVSAFALSLPWRIWFESHGLASDAPESGGTGLLAHLGRAWPSLWLALRDLFTYDLWLVVAPLVLVAVAAALLAGSRVLASYTGLLCLFLVGGFTWITWSFPSLPITEDASVNPITRAVGSLVVISAGIVPLLLAGAWRPRGVET